MNAIYADLCAEAINLTKDEKIALLNIVRLYDPNKIQEFSDGSRICLNKLPDDVVKQMHRYVQTRLQLSSEKK